MISNTLYAARISYQALKPSFPVVARAIQQEHLYNNDRRFWTNADVLYILPFSEIKDKGGGGIISIFARGGSPHLRSGSLRTDLK